MEIYYMGDKDLELLKKWCSDCKHRNNTILHDPCHYCIEEPLLSQNNFVPKHYEEDK